jgi:DNA-binding beta-propeller fold protein YncE
MTNYKICAFVALLAASAGAQPGRFDLPAAGFVYSRGARAVRPLLGVPGATHLGAAVLQDVDAAWISPGGKFAFVTTPDGAGFLRGLSGPLTAAGAIDAVDRVVWNRDASLALLYSSSSGRLQRVRFTDDNIIAEDPIDLTALGAPTALAIDAAGRRIAFGIAGAGVYVIDGGQSPALLSGMTRPATAAFGDNGALYAVDADTRRIVQFAAEDASPSDFAVADAIEGAEFDPVGVAVSASGNFLMLADRGARNLRVYDIAARTAVNNIPLDFAPAHIQRLSGATFLLNRPRNNEWLLVLDAADAPRVWFVPAGTEDAQ